MSPNIIDLKGLLLVVYHAEGGEPLSKVVKADFNTAWEKVSNEYASETGDDTVELYLDHIKVVEDMPDLKGLLLVVYHAEGGESLSKVVKADSFDGAWDEVCTQYAQESGDDTEELHLDHIKVVEEILPVFISLM